MGAMLSLKPKSVGATGGALLFILFFIILAVAESWAHTWERFGTLWPWVLLLSTSFGLQAGLFWFIRQQIQRRRSQGTAALAASGSISTGATIACCLHHGTDVLPVLGLSILAPFLTRYQPFFLTVGIMANLFGISVMLLNIQRLQLSSQSQGLLGRLLRLDLPLVRNGTLALSLFVLPLAFWLNSLGGEGSPPADTTIPPTTTTLPPLINLAPQTGQAEGLEIAVTPRTIYPGSPLRFDLSFDTHSGSLEFDLTGTAVLADSLGNRYSPLSWEGDPAGGHHRSGTLTFAPVAPNAQWLQLTFSGLHGVPERTFRWSLK